MGLVLPDKWLWDFWLVTDGPDVHVFYLQAPRTLRNPELRHWNVSIGHAVTRDLHSWTVLADALTPGPEGTWDDCTTWTGSVVHDGDRWVMFYTGTSRADDGLVQAIGAVVSDDLMTWTRPTSGPVVTLDPSMYEVLDRTVWHDQAWRDPWVHRMADGRWRMLLTARVKNGSPARRGVIATATSADLWSWEVGAPITQPGQFGHMEIPQLEQVGDRWVLLFSAPGSTAVDARPLDRAGTHYLVGDSPDGPFPWSSHGALLGGDGKLYGGKLVHHDGRWQCLAWRAIGADGRFVGGLSDPWDVTFDGHRLELQRFADA